MQGQPNGRAAHLPPPSPPEGAARLGAVPVEAPGGVAVFDAAGEPPPRDETPIPRPAPTFDLPADDPDSGGELIGEIVEAQVTWDADGGHNHDGTVSRAITISGDASGTNLATTVTKLFNLTIATPAAGDDAQFLRYNHATGYSWETAISAITVQEGDTTVDSAVTVLDFAAAEKAGRIQLGD